MPGRVLPHRELKMLASEDADEGLSRIVPGGVGHAAYLLVQRVDRIDPGDERYVTMMFFLYNVAYEYNG